MYWRSATNLKRAASTSWSSAAITQPRFLEWRYEFAALLGDVRATPRSGTTFVPLLGLALQVKQFHTGDALQDFRSASLINSGLTSKLCK